jgi:hypothetical protein
MMIGGKKRNVVLARLRNTGVLTNFRPTEEQVKGWTTEAGLKINAGETWVAADNKWGQDNCKAKLSEFRAFLTANERRATQKRPSRVSEKTWNAYIDAVARFKTVLGQVESFVKKNLGGGQFVVGTIMLPGGGSSSGTTVSLSPADVQAAVDAANGGELEVEEASILPSGIFGGLLGSARSHPVLWGLSALGAAVGGWYLWKRAPKAMPPSAEFLKEQEEI